MAPLTPLGTFRIVGVAMAAQGQAVDLAIVEADGLGRIRLIESEREPLLRASTESLEATVAAEVLTFMGDRSLQPFAVDAVAVLGSQLDPQLLASSIGAEVYLVSETDPVRSPDSPLDRAEHAAVQVANRLAQMRLTPRAERQN